MSPTDDDAAAGPSASSKDLSAKEAALEEKMARIRAKNEALMQRHKEVEEDRRRHAGDEEGRTSR